MNLTPDFLKKRRRITDYLLFIIMFISLNITICEANIQKHAIKGKFLINHVIYLQEGFKKLVFQTKSEMIPNQFAINDMKGNTIYKGVFKKGGQIDNWHTGNAYEGIFTNLKQTGKFRAVVGTGDNTVKSRIFTIKEKGLSEKCLPLLIKAFQSQRCKAPFDEKDSKISFFGNRTDTVDVHGGWYDASGEKGKYLSHLCFTNYMAPQQTPMFVWNMLESSKRYAGSGSKDTGILNSIDNEAVYGADFLVRMQDKEGYFYLIVFANWTCDAEKREICAYEGHNGKKTEDYKAGFREGGGMAIAALARMSTTGLKGDFSSKTYLRAAIKGFEHLLKNNKKYIDDGKENIMDCYCSLMASTELFGATKKIKYLEYSRKRMKELSKYLKNDEKYSSWWSSDIDGKRPFYHAADAGLPLIALYRYLQFENDKKYRGIAISTVRKSVEHELQITNEVNNPYGYPRQYVFSPNSKKRSSFFIPHKNESGYWWQGENARISSLSCAFQLVLPYLSESRKYEAKKYSINQINWILGLNPYDVCMLEGIGKNNPDYKEGGESLNYKGGVCNGITSGVKNESDIAFMSLPWNNDPNFRWRWSEQWLPHASWFMLAVSNPEL